MASTTTNLGLTKPAYSDDADISDINGNMDLIDAEAGKVRANVAANYDSSETYAVGDYCLHDGSLYKCSTAISSPEAWTAGHWTQIKIAGELSTLNGNITSLSDQIGDVVHYKSVTIPMATAGTSWTPESRNIGSVISLLGLSPSDNLVSLFAYDTAFTPAANASFGMFNGNLYVSSSQNATLESDLKLQVGYSV